MKNTMIISSAYHSRFDSGFVLSSIFASLSRPIISVWKAVLKMGYDFLSVASLSRAVIGYVSKGCGGVFVYARRLSYLNSYISHSTVSDGPSLLYA